MVKELGDYPHRQEIASEIGRIVVTPDVLYADNRTDESQQAIEQWELNRRKGKLTAVVRCADSRLVIPSTISVEIPVIAAGGSKDPYIGLLNDRSIQTVVILAHHDGDTVKPGESPKGCGGLGAKSQGITGEEGLARFIGEDIYHPDVIVQAIISAEDAARLTPKPVIAATQDHRTGNIYPIAAFLDSGERIITAVRMRDLFDQNYDPKRIYADGLPYLQDDKLPDELVEFLETSRAEASGLRRRFADFRQWQKTQNPLALLISANIRNASMRYRNTFELPGVVFGLRVPRNKIDGTVLVRPENFKPIIEQSEYPMEHFSKLNTVVIETGAMDISRELALEFVQQRHVEEWRKANPNRQIILVETNGAETTDVQYFTA